MKLGRIISLEAEAIVGTAKSKINDDKLIVMKGPISEIMTRALNIVCAKQDNATGEYVMESQAIDAVILRKQQEAKMDAVNPDHAPGKAVDITNSVPMSSYSIYGVNAVNTKAQDIVSLKHEVDALDPQERERFVVVIDACQAGKDSPNATAPAAVYARSLTHALEAYCTMEGIKVFPKLSAALESFY